MKLVHTSPARITVISKHGLFDDCLFFSVDQYAMGRVAAVYSIEIEDDRIITASNLYHDETAQHIASVLECSIDDAQSLLNDEIIAGDLTGDYEDGWFIQAQQGAVRPRQWVMKP